MRYRSCWSKVVFMRSWCHWGNVGNLLGRALPIKPLWYLVLVLCGLIIMGIVFFLGTGVVLPSIVRNLVVVGRRTRPVTSVGLSYKVGITASSLGMKLHGGGIYLAPCVWKCLLKLSRCPYHHAYVLLHRLQDSRIASPLYVITCVSKGLSAV